MAKRSTPVVYAQGQNGDQQYHRGMDDVDAAELLVHQKGGIEGKQQGGQNFRREAAQGKQADILNQVLILTASHTSASFPYLFNRFAGQPT